MLPVTKSGLRIGFTHQQNWLPKVLQTGCLKRITLYVTLKNALVLTILERDLRKTKITNYLIEQGLCPTQNEH